MLFLQMFSTDLAATHPTEHSYNVELTNQQVGMEIMVL